MWSALREELKWTELQVTRLQNLVDDVEPLVDIKAPHGLTQRVVGQMRVVAHEDSEVATAA